MRALNIFRKVFIRYFPSVVKENSQIFSLGYRQIYFLPKNSDTVQSCHETALSLLFFRCMAEKRP